MVNSPLVFKTLLLFVVYFSAFVQKGQAQQGETDLSGDAPLTASAYASLSKKTLQTEQDIDKATSKYLAKLQKQEAKLKKKLWKKDSVLAKQLFEGVEEKYQSLQNTPQKLSKYSNVYSGHLDSLTTALKFLKGTNLPTTELQATLTKYTDLQGKFNQTEVVKKFISERKQLLKEQFEKLGMLKDLKGFQKQAYYYSQQLREVRAMWEDPSRLEEKLMELVMKSEKFKEFFRENSQLGSLFALPGGSTGTASLQGLQTRASVQQAITARFGSGLGVQQMISQNIGAAQGQLSELKSKLSQYSSGSVGNSSSDLDLPEGLKPNSQKTKTFLQRLEYGANIQSQKARSYFPVTSDIGLSLGYKLSDKSSVGLGASYKLGWGRGWNNIRLTHEGVGLRSYLDYQLKGTLYIAGGYEQNYRTALEGLTFSSLNGGGRERATWQTSGLLGLSKKYKISKKLKGDMKLLWNFLSNQQMPRTQAILIRIGYSLK